MFTWAVLGCVCQEASSRMGCVRGRGSKFSIGSGVIMSDKPEPRWDLDYKAGRQAELWVQNLRKSLEEDTIEVKLDRRFPDTGNIYVEYECKRRGSMRPSGIATTTSRLWIQVLVEDELALIISTDRLKEIARQYF